MQFHTEDSRNAVTGNFKAQIKVDTSIDAYTEVYTLPATDEIPGWYPNGFDVTISAKYDEYEPVVEQKIEGNKVYFKVTNEEFNGQ